ncbi:hypothetical protein CY652_22900 [Burkholderia sp. WAC0059]|nr:hypothetical protein CY652_22900 [Burkholderia sp. WAC0059]
MLLGFGGNRVAWSGLALVASRDANDDSPIAVDLVFVSDDAMLARVSGLSSAQWFDTRSDLAATFPKSVRYLSWEIVPGQRIEVPAAALRGPRAAAAFVFANYASPGAHRVRLQQFSGRPALMLEGRTFTVSTTP